MSVREGELVSQVKDVHHKLLTALEHRHRCGQVVAASIRHTIDGARTAVSQEGSVGVVVAREELRASLAFQWDVIVGVTEGVCGVRLDGHSVVVGDRWRSVCDGCRRGSTIDVDAAQRGLGFGAGGGEEGDTPSGAEDDGGRKGVFAHLINITFRPPRDNKPQNNE